MQSLILPPGYVRRDLDATIYLDASGSADRDRVWGCVVAIDDAQRHALLAGLRRLRRQHPASLTADTREPKNLSTSGIVESIQYLDSCGILLGPYPVPAWSTREMQELAGVLPSLFEQLRPNVARPDARLIERRRRRLLRYLTETNANPRNRHKLVSMLSFCNRVATFMQTRGITPRLRGATLYADNEDFRMPRECAWALKWQLAAVLQGAGMHAAVTGAAPFETSFRGTVRVRVNCQSHRFAGIQYADIVARATARGTLALMG